MKKIISIIFFLLFQQNVNSQTVGSFNGIQNTSNSFEKLFDIPSFPNGVSNLAIDFSIGNISFWGYIELEITGFFYYQNTPGKLTKVFAIGTNPNGLIYENESRVTDALGAIVNNISIGDFKWDASNSRFSIPISHIVSTMNNFTLKVRAFSHGGGANTLVNSMFVSPIYNLPALSRNFISFNDKVGVGTITPQTLLNINHGAGDINTGTAALRVGGTGNYPSLELGIKGAYDGMISTYGNDLHIYAGNWRSNGSTASEDHSISFYTSQSGSTNWNTPKMFLNHAGNVGIGTTNPSEKLSVNGSIRAKKLIVSQQNWSDYVFYKNYKLRSLNELEKYIQQYQHLPDIPSTKEVQAKGINLGDTQALLLKKIEELTLYVIELKKENIEQNMFINKLMLNAKYK
jgi:hypothetical protein